jgi:hypothetical protein
MSTRAEAKLARTEAAAAAAEAGQGAGTTAVASNRFNGFNPAVVPTGSIPNPQSNVTMVAVAVASITPRVTGKIRVRITIQTTVNADAAAQSVHAEIGHSAAPIVVGTTILPADGTAPAAPPTPVAIAGSATVSQELIYGGSPTQSRTAVGLFPIGVNVNFAALLTQTVAGAFALNAGGAQIEVDELLA